MKESDLINEMTMLVGSYEALGNYLHLFVDYDKTGQHAGDIEQFKVFKLEHGSTIRYAVFDKDIIAAFFTTTDNTLEAIYVVPIYRKQGLFPAILWFLKRNEKFDRIMLGVHHSQDTYLVIKRIYKRFEKVYWQKDNEKIKYDPNTVNQFYSATGPTGWQLVFEHCGQNLGESKNFDPFNLSTWYFNLLD